MLISFVASLSEWFFKVKQKKMLGKNRGKC